MTSQQSLEILDSINLHVWFLLLKFGVAAFLVIVTKNFVTHVYNYLALRFSTGFGVNTKIEYDGELYYLDQIKFTDVVLIKKNKRVFIPISRFTSLPIHVVRNGSPRREK